MKTSLTPQSNVTFGFSECNYQQTAEKRESLVCRQHEGLREGAGALDPSTQGTRSYCRFHHSPTDGLGVSQSKNGTYMGVVTNTVI